MNLNADDFLLMLCATLLLANFIILVGKVVAIIRVKKLMEMIVKNPEIVKSINIQKYKDDNDGMD